MKRLKTCTTHWLRPIVVLLAMTTAFMLLSAAPGLLAAELSQGQTLYVPAYSHIYIGHKSVPYQLSITLSIRNIDPSSPLTVLAVDYRGSDGQQLKHFLDKPLVLAPMSSARYVVPMQDETGGSGANFIVRWKADKKINPLIAESIMIGTKSQQGISFTSRGLEILE